MDLFSALIGFFAGCICTFLGFIWILGTAAQAGRVRVVQKTPDKDPDHDPDQDHLAEFV